MPFKDPAMGGCGTRQIARPKEETFCFTDIMMVRPIRPCILSQFGMLKGVMIEWMNDEI